jgi:hypothetical protein
MDRGGALDMIGRDRLFGTFEEAVAHARVILVEPKGASAGRPVQSKGAGELERSGGTPSK